MQQKQEPRFNAQTKLFGKQVTGKKLQALDYFDMSCLLPTRARPPSFFST
jgi:hypothetical protein